MKATAKTRKAWDLQTSVCSYSIARLFSQSVVREIAKKGKSPTFARLLRESGAVDILDKSAPLYEFYNEAFDFLNLRDNRHEYVYKAAITQRVLLGVHNLNTASMMTEFRVGKCKADVVILNGTGTAYEIKSERDSLARLKVQTNAYLKVFESVNVIVGENHIKDVLSTTHTDVGVMLLTNSFSISTVRKNKKDLNRVQPFAIFDCVNLAEAEAIIRRMGIECPVVPNTKRYDMLRDLFSKLSAKDAHEGMVAVLKQTRKLDSLKTMLGAIPTSLHSAALSAKFRVNDRLRFSKTLQTTVGNALHWAD